VLSLNHFSKKTGTRIAFVIISVCLIIPIALPAQDIKEEISNMLNSGDTTRAITMLENEIKLDPSYEYNYLVLGDIYKKRKKYDLAMEQYQKSVDKNKKFFPGLYALSMMQLQMGQLDEAEKNLSNGLKKSKKLDKAKFHNGMAKLYMVRGNYNDADSEIRKALIIDSTNSEFYVNLGDVNYRMQIYPLAIDNYAKALELDTASLDVYFHWAEACLELKDYTCALEKLNIVLQKDSTHADAWMKAGGIYYKAARSSRNANEAKDHYKSTIGSYKKYFELSKDEPDSTNGRAFYEAGMSYLILGGYEEALENFRTVLSIPVEPKDIYFYYARSFHGISNTDTVKADMVKMYDSALVYYNIQKEKMEDEDYRSSVSMGELYKRMGECYESLKDYYNTITYYKKSLEYDSTQARLLYGVAVAYNHTQDFRNALIYYMKRIALGIDERYWSIYYNAAMAALYLADKGGAAMVEDEDLGEEEEFAVSEPVSDPLEGVDLARLAVEYLEKIAVDHWEFVSQKSPAIGIKDLGRLGSTYLYQLGDCENGVKYLERVLELEPDNCDALKSMGYAYFGGVCTYNYTKALTYLRKALDCRIADGSTRCEEIDLVLWIGQTYQFRGLARLDAKQKEESKADFKAAHDWYLDCLKCDPGNKSCIEGEQQTKFMY